MDSGPRKQALLRIREFLRNKMRSPDVSGEIIVRRHEVEEIGRNAGIDEKEAWRMFREMEGHEWRGWYMPESRSEERG